MCPSWPAMTVQMVFVCRVELQRARALPERQLHWSCPPVSSVQTEGASVNAEHAWHSNRVLPFHVLDTHWGSICAEKWPVPVLDMRCIIVAVWRGGGLLHADPCGAPHLSIWVGNDGVSVLHLLPGQCRHPMLDDVPCTGWRLLSGCLPLAASWMPPSANLYARTKHCCFESSKYAHPK